MGLIVIVGATATGKTEQSFKVVGSSLKARDFFQMTNGLNDFTNKAR